MAAHAHQRILRLPERVEAPHREDPGDVGAPRGPTSTGGADMPHTRPHRRPLGIPHQRRPLHQQGDWISRLAGKVTVHPDGCWIYGPDPNTYAQVAIGGVQEQLHRAVYVELHGPIPRRMHVHHVCQRPACINPDHLEALTPSEHAHAHALLRRVAAVATP